MARTVELDGKKYIVDKLPLRKAMHIWRRVEWAFLKTVQEQALHNDLLQSTIVHSQALASLSDADYDQYYYGLLSAVKRKESEHVLVNLIEPDSLELRYQDISKKDLDLLFKESMEENFKDFFPSAEPNLIEQSPAPSAP